MKKEDLVKRLNLKIKQKFGKQYIRAGNKHVFLMEINSETNEINLKLMRKNDFYNKYKSNSNHSCTFV